MRLPLRVKFFVFAVLLALVPLGLVGSNLIRITRDELISAANEDLTNVAAQLAADIDSIWRGQLMAPLLVIREGMDSPDLDVPQKISILTLGIAEMRSVKALQLTIVGSDLPVLVTDQAYVARLRDAGADPITVLRLGVSDIQMISRDQQFEVPIVRKIPETGDWLARIVLPLRTQIAGRPVTLSAEIVLNDLIALRERHPFLERGEISLVDATGFAQLHSDADSDLSDREIVAQVQGLIETNARAVALQSYVRQDGTEMLGAYAFSREFPWAVVTELREAAAYGVVDQMTRTILIVAGVGFAVAGVGALIFAQGLTRPILRIGEAARAVGQGNFGVRLPVVRARDEIGDLAMRFNAMIGELNERVELMKFVSQGTVSAVQQARQGGVTRMGERRHLAVLFSDIRGYTSFSESVPPETVVEMLNLYLDSQTQSIRAHDGDVDKFVGDAVVAIFDGPDRERRAVQCGLEIQVKMQILLAEHRDWNLTLGIGIAAGEVVLGAMGAKDRMDFTVLGSAVNLAARLCAQAPGGDVLVNAAIRDATVVADAPIAFDVLEPLVLKGYATPVPAFAARAA
jgi:adenylate cyclase